MIVCVRMNRLLRIPFSNSHRVFIHSILCERRKNPNRKRYTGRETGKRPTSPTDRSPASVKIIFLSSVSLSLCFFCWFSFYSGFFLDFDSFISRVSSTFLHPLFLARHSFFLSHHQKESIVVVTPFASLLDSSFPLLLPPPSSPSCVDQSC